MELKYIDIHSHFDDKQFDTDRDEVIARLKDTGGGTITIGVDLLTSQKVVSLAGNYENVWACVGVHPEDGLDAGFDQHTFEELVQHEKVVAIGECGLDYFRTLDKDDARKKQLPLFEAQIELAAKYNKPLMLHVRPSKGTLDTYEEVVEILKSYKQKYPHLRGNSHFFAGSVAIAKKLFEIDFTVSFTGVITFARDYDEVIQYAPLNMIHAETDAPYVAPIPYRGQRNEPAYVREVLKKIAEIKNKDLQEVMEDLRHNAQKMFNIDFS